MLTELKDCGENLTKMSELTTEGQQKFKSFSQLEGKIICLWFRSSKSWVNCAPGIQY